MESVVKDLDEGDAESERAEAVFVQEGFGQDHTRVCPLTGFTCDVVILTEGTFPCKHCPQEEVKQ